MPRKRLLFLTVVLVLAALLAMDLRWHIFIAEGEAPRTIRVGLYENPPKIYTRADQPAGLFVDLLKGMAHLEPWRFKYVACEWEECLNLLEQDKIDLMPDVAFSAERAQHFDFNQVSVANSWSQVYTRPNLMVQTFADLADKRIAVLQGGIQQSFLAQMLDDLQLRYQAVPVNTLDEAYRAVAEGRADAVVTNSFFAAHNGAKYRLRETPTVFLPSTLYFAAPKGRNADLLERIDAHLTDWRRVTAVGHLPAVAPSGRQAHERVARRTGKSGNPGDRTHCRTARRQGRSRTCITGEK